MLQPGIAFFEEGLGYKRKSAMGILAALTGLGTFIIWWFSKDLKARSICSPTVINPFS